MKKYAIKVRLSVGDWIYVTNIDGNLWEEPEPILFETEEDAEKFAHSWRQKGKESFVKVVEYYKETT